MAITTLVASANRQKTSYTNNGFSTDTIAGGVNFPLQSGVPYQNLYMFKVVPAVFSATCIAQSQGWPGSGVSYTLNAASTTSGTQTVSAAITYANLSAIKLDCERHVTFTIAGTTTAETVLAITGYDYRGTLVEQAVTVISGTAGGIGQFNQSLNVITGITASANPGVDISFGNSQYIGLPYLLLNKQCVVTCVYAGDAIDVATNVVIGNVWRTGAPTTITDDPDPARGYVELPTTPDGSSPLIITYFVAGSDSEMNAELMNGVQSTIKLANVQTNESGEYVVPYLTQYDLVGMLFPGDYDAAYLYNTLLDA